MMLVLAILLGGVNYAFAIGETMTSKTVEGVTMRFEVTKDSPKECKVTALFDDSGDLQAPCIDGATEGKVTIPETVMGYTVTEIGLAAFMLCTSVEEIVIPQTVRTIGAGAFDLCTSLQKCWLPDALETLGTLDGSGAQFWACYNLTDVYLPHHIKSIPKGMFESCTSLKHIEIPASVTSIGDQAFRGCSSLEYVSFLGSCPSFGTDVFKDTPSYKYYEYTGSLISFIVPTSTGYEDVIPNFFNGVYTDPTNFTVGLQNNTLYGFNERETMGYMVNIQFKQGTSTYECIYRGTLEEVNDETFTLPEEILGYPITELNSVKWNNGSMAHLKKAVIPGTCKKIGNYDYIKAGFEGCTALEEVEIQEGVDFIGYGVFSNTALKELRLPESLQTYYSAVQSCSNLTDVYCPVFNLSLSVPFESQPSSSQATLHVPFGAAQNYANWIPREFANIEEGEPHDGDLFYAEYKSGKNMLFQIISVADNTCRTYGENKSNKTCIDINTEGSVTIPKTARSFDVVEIGDFSFGNTYPTGGGCEKVSFFSIPNSIKRIGEFAFAQCDGLVSVSIPNSVETIGGAAFWTCDGLVNVTLPDGLTAIEDMTFDHCAALESIDLPAGITKLGYSAFGWSGLTSIEIPECVERIESNCFRSCKQLTSVVMNQGVKSIGWYGFKDCESLTSIDLPATLNELDYQAFKNCLKLADVKIRNPKMQLINTYAPSAENNEAFDLKTDRYAELTVPKGAFEAYNQDPWFLWFNKISYTLEPTGISLPATPSSLPAAWYTLDGQQLPTAPTRPGLYIQNGKKTIVK